MLYVAICRQYLLVKTVIKMYFSVLSALFGIHGVLSDALPSALPSALLSALLGAFGIFYRAGAPICSLH